MAWDDRISGLWGGNPSRCQACGSPFCQGQCQAQAQAYQAQKMLEYQQKLIQHMQSMAITPPKPKKVAPLPETEEFCATGGIVGWRSWRVDNFGKVIMSINKTEWPVRKQAEAVCLNGKGQCLGNTCECGLYAWKVREKLDVNRTEHQAIDGEVWLWGRIIEHELGYRAEFAYPKTFVNSGGLARKMAAIYGVKLI